jgi:sugar lactone lactonase YvrE
VLWNEQKTSVGTWDARGQGLGGWTIDVHHAYDPVGKILYLGDGSRQSGTGLGMSTVINTVAGGSPGTCGGVVDGRPATQATICPQGVAVGPDGSLYIAENWFIRRVSPDGIITTVAGNGWWGYSGDGGPATQAVLSYPRGVAVGPDGSLYIADSGNHHIRRVGPDGIISTVAGDPIYSHNGYSGDGGPATEALLNYPTGITLSPDGSLYFADTINNRIRRVSPAGIITTVAGNGVAGYGGDGGPATQAALNYPWGVAVGPDGSLYIADSQNQSIRRVGPDGIITTVAGNGVNGYGGDGGPPTQAVLSYPRRVAVGPDGNIYFADSGNVRIRRI